MSGVALVTGGGRGLGGAIAMELAASGFDIALNYHRSEQNAVELSQRIAERHGSRVSLHQADIRDYSEVKRMVGAETSNGGSIDVLVNNAGIRRDQLFAFQDTESFWEVMFANLGGTINCCRAVLPAMLQRRNGIIVNISSISGRRGVAGQTAYGASKAAIEGFTRSLSKEVGPHGISVVAVAPGLLETDMARDLPERVIQSYISGSPARRLGRADEVAKMVACLALGMAGLSQGQTIVLDGGTTA